MNENLEIIQNYWGRGIENGQYQSLNQVFSESERVEIAKVPWYRIVVFDGFEEQMKKIQSIEKETREDSAPAVSQSLPKAVVIPPSGFFTEQDILELNKVLFLLPTANQRISFIENEKNVNTAITDFVVEKKGITKTSAQLFAKYISRNQTSLTWDDRRLYRIYAIVEFVRQDKFNTLGEFVEHNEKSLIDKTLYADFSDFSEFSSFVTKMINDENILSWRKRSAKKNEKLIYSLNRQELISLMKRKPEYTAESNYSSYLQSSIEASKSASDMSKNEIFKILSEVSLNISQRKDYWDSGLFQEANKAGQKAVFAVEDYTSRGVHPGLISIVEFIEEYQNDLSILDFVVLLKWFPKANYVIRSADFNKSMNVFKIVVDKFDNPVGFVKLLTRLFLTHEGVIPSYTEWKKYIDTMDKDEDFSLPISLTLPLIVSRMDPTVSMRNYMQIIESVRNNYKAISLPEDRY